MRTLNEQALLDDPAVSMWLKEAIIMTRHRDPIDVINDVSLLLRLAQQRNEALQKANAKGLTLAEIKQALAEGKKVFWSNTGYEVIKDNIGQYLITCHFTDYCIGLTKSDGITLNGAEKDFFTE